MPQYEAGSDGKCFNIRQGVRGGVLQYSLGSSGNVLQMVIYTYFKQWPFHYTDAKFGGG